MSPTPVDPVADARQEVHGHMAAIVTCLDVTERALAATPAERACLLACVAHEADALVGTLDRLEELTGDAAPA